VKVAQIRVLQRVGDDPDTEAAAIFHG
jgi:hypothetical protein